jgi:hypothetical protein
MKACLTVVGSLVGVFTYNEIVFFSITIGIKSFLKLDHLSIANQ